MRVLNVVVISQSTIIDLSGSNQSILSFFTCTVSSRHFEDKRVVQLRMHVGQVINMDQTGNPSNWLAVTANNLLLASLIGVQA